VPVVNKKLIFNNEIYSVLDGVFNILSLNFSEALLILGISLFNNSYFKIIMSSED